MAYSVSVLMVQGYPIPVVAGAMLLQVSGNIGLQETRGAALLDSQGSTISVGEICEFPVPWWCFSG
jgi:hypothetical protein